MRDASGDNEETRYKIEREQRFGSFLLNKTLEK